jgi:hypothetical protein
MVNEKHPAEEIAELLGDPLPADWRDQLAVEARADHLAALASAAAEAGWALILRGAEVGKVPPEDEAVDALVDAALELEKGLRRYTHDTQRGDGNEIAYTAIALRLGAVGGDWIMAGIGRIRGAMWERAQAVYAAEQLSDRLTH